MSDQLTRWLCENSGELSKHEYTNDEGNPKQILTGQRLRLLLSMLGHANEDYMVWCSVGRYMREAKLNSQSVQDHLKLLEQLGWIKKDGKEPSNTGRASIRYEITLPNQPAKEVKTPEAVPTVVPTHMPTLMPTGKHLTRTRTKTTHTAETAVSSISPAANRHKLKRVSTEYGKQALEQALLEGQQIKSPAAFSAHMAKQVSDPASELNDKALQLIEQHPDMQPAEIVSMLCETSAPKPQRHNPAYESALTGVMGIYRAYGLAEAIEACNGQGAWADELKVFVHKQEQQKLTQRHAQQGVVA
jgi:hypothetical protein